MLWDPLLDALIPELFEFPPSDQHFLSYECPNIFTANATIDGRFGAHF
jgi:hypothetical protein